MAVIEKPWTSLKVSGPDLVRAQRPLTLSSLIKDKEAFLAERKFACAVLGPRELSKRRAPYVEEALQEEFESALKSGHTHFYIAYYDGVPLMFAKMFVNKMAERSDIVLDVVVEFDYDYEGENEEMAKFLAEHDFIKVLDPNDFDRPFVCVNHFLVECTDLVIIVFDKHYNKQELPFAKRYIRHVGTSQRVIELPWNTGFPDSYEWYKLRLKNWRESLFKAKK